MMKRGMLLSTLVFVLSIAGLPREVEANELRGIWQNNQGVRRHADKRPVEAYDRFNDAMADLPFAPEVHYNLGNSFFDNKEFEKALSEYRQSIKYSGTEGLSKGRKTAVEETRFRALFNSGVTLSELKRYDEAIEAYQQALDIKPDSIETKTNIELLTQMQDGQGGEGQDQKDKNQQDKGDKNKDQKGEGDKDKEKDQQQPKQNQGQKPKPSPRPFKSEELTQQDVGRILEELKRQEDQIRAKMQREGAKDAPRDKDW